MNYKHLLYVDRSICENTKEIEHFQFNIDELEFKTNPNKLILKHMLTFLILLMLTMKMK